MNEELKIDNYEKAIKEILRQSKEIERLNEELKQAKEIALNDHKYASEMEDKYITANNIINEFESWLKAHLEDEFYWFKMYDKLQELKGDGSNE